MRISDDLRNRTQSLASNIVTLYDTLPERRKAVEVLGHQLLRSGTSVAANVREASRARSDDEFCAKLGIAIQEADESMLWMELLKERPNLMLEGLDALHQEANEIMAILITMVGKTRSRLRG